jgi:RNA polymerase sigma-70 factor (ECF subfamily)
MLCTRFCWDRSSKVTQWVTTTQLLEDLKTTDDESAWTEFCSHFQPVVIDFARKLGVSNVEAEDAAQETMAAFFKAFREGKYDPAKGRLSNWLFGIAKRVILNLRGRQPLEKLIADKATGTSFWDMVQDDRTLGRTWESQWQQMVLKRCLEQVRREFDPKVFGAFRHYAIDQFTIEDVCQRFDMSRNAVYIAKSRILSRLRELKQQFE